MKTLASFFFAWAFAWAEASAVAAGYPLASRVSEGAILCGCAKLTPNRNRGSYLPAGFSFNVNHFCQAPCTYKAALLDQHGQQLEPQLRRGVSRCNKITASLWRAGRSKDVTCAMLAPEFDCKLHEVHSDHSFLTRLGSGIVRFKYILHAMHRSSLVSHITHLN